MKLNELYSMHYGNWDARRALAPVWNLTRLKRYEIGWISSELSITVHQKQYLLERHCITWERNSLPCIKIFNFTLSLLMRQQCRLFQERGYSQLTTAKWKSWLGLAGDEDATFRLRWKYVDQLTEWEISTNRSNCKLRCLTSGCRE